MASQESPEWAEFWAERWREDRIGFHKDVVNPNLVRHADQFLNPGDRVFVPLCGKSLDLIWLEREGYQVIGIEVVEKAVIDFHLEQAREYRVVKRPDHERYESGSITTIRGDALAVDRDAVGDFDAVYDRASFIALPPKLRVEFAQRLTSWIEPGQRMLLVAIDYPQPELEGPPFSVPEDELRRHFEPHFDLTLVDRRDVLDSESRWRERGLTRLEEWVWRLTRRAD